MKSLKTILGIALSIGGFGTAATVAGLSAVDANKNIDSEVRATEVPGNLLFFDTSSISWWPSDSVTKAHMYTGNTTYTTWPGEEMHKIDNTNLFFVHANSSAKNVIFTRVVGGNVVNRSSKDGASKPLSLTNIGTKNTWKQSTDTSDWDVVEGNASAGSWNNTTWTWSVVGATSGTWTSESEDIAISLGDYKYDDTPEFYSTSVTLSKNSVFKIKDNYGNYYGFSALKTDSFSSKYFSNSSDNVKVNISGTFEIYMKPALGEFWIQVDGKTHAMHFAEHFVTQTNGICSVESTSADHSSLLEECWNDSSSQTGSFSLAGTFNGWSAEDTTYTLRKTGDHTWMFSNIYLSNSDSLKVVVNNSWDTSYPGSNHNISGGEGYYKIVFDDQAHTVTSTKFVYLNNLYATLTNSAKDTFKAGTADTVITNALSRYRHIVNRYGGLNDFVGGIRQSSNRIIAISNNTNSTAILIVAIGVVSVTALGVFLFVRKKKEN